MADVSKGCEYIIQKGKRKGNRCEKPVENKKRYCKFHASKSNPGLSEVSDSKQLTLDKQIMKLDTSLDNKVVMLRHFNSMKTTDPTSTEYYKNQGFLEWCFSVPWNRYTKFPVDFTNDKNEIKDFLERVQLQLDEHIYGMHHVKNEIVNFVAKRISNPLSEKNNLALIGPPGVAKTTFVKVLSETLSVPLKIIPMGGVKDSSYFTGHSYVYVESNPGQILQSIVQCKSMNPILLFDEIDKVSMSELGKDVHSFFINLVDPATNSRFVDHYFQRMTFDLSKIMFVFTMNDTSNVSPVLLDRLNVVHVEEPTVEDKKHILVHHCLPDIVNNIGLSCKVEICKASIDWIFDKICKGSTVPSLRYFYRVVEKLVLEANKRKLMLIPPFINETINIDESIVVSLFESIRSQILLNETDHSTMGMYI